jgi:N-acetylneuraminic acid mutarotase
MAVTYNGYVYVMGGYDSGFNSTHNVYYSKINSDGTLGSWTTSSSTLPALVATGSAAVYNGYVYVLGGYDSNTTNTLNGVYYAKLNNDGSVGTWTTSGNSLPADISTASSVVNNGYIYEIGGQDDNFNALATVYYAKLNSNGSIGSWTTSNNPLPQPVSVSGAVVYNNNVYLVGGSDANGDALATSYYSTLSSVDGSNSTWSTASSNLPKAVDSGGVDIYNGYIYQFGGLDENFTNQSTVYYSQIYNPVQVASSNSSKLTSASLDPSSPDTGYGELASNQASSRVELLLILSSIVLITYGIRSYIKNKYS